MKQFVDECKKAGLPEPEFREEIGGLSVFFRTAELSERLGESGEKKVADKVVDKVADKVVDKVGAKLAINQQKIIELIEKEPSISARKLSGLIGISQRKIQENIAKLKTMGILERMGPDKGGTWRING